MTCSFLGYPFFISIGRKLWFYGKRYSYVTPADFIAHRYQSGGIARLLVGAVIFGYCSLFYMIIQIKGCAWALEEAISLSPFTATLIICLVLAFYTYIGGIRGVAYVDLLQASVLLTSLIVLAITMITRNGGLGPIFVAMEAARPGALLPKRDFTLMMSSTIVMCVSFILWPTMWTKFYCAKNLKSSWGVLTGSAFGNIFITVGLPLIFLAGLSINYPASEPSAADRLMVRYVLNFSHPFVAGLLVSGLLSAAISTAAGVLLSISSVFTIDLPKLMPENVRAKLNDKRLFVVGRTVSLICIAIGFVISLMDLGQIINLVTAYAYPGYLLMLPLVLGGFYWRRANKQGMTWGLIVGMMVLAYTTYFLKTPFMNIHAGIWAVLACSVVFIVVSLCTEPMDDAHLAQFGLLEGQTSFAPISSETQL
jgi:SSS family solute:Na+ symporter